jgi:branched-chain amino acid transport system ATP-binding protein
MERLGLRDVADELAADQSVGIVRMVDLARALASRPQVLLLDEPVSGLSEPEAAQVARMLLDLRADHDLSMLVIEHDLEFARMVADRMLALDFGAVIVEGTADEVLGSQALRRAYFGDGSAAAVATSVDPG